MDWLLAPESVGGKFLLMFFAIALFVSVMTIILLAVDREGLPRWVPVLGFLGPTIVLLSFGLVYPALATINLSFKDASGNSYIGFSNYVQALTDGQMLIVLRNTALWVIIVPIVSTLLGLIYAVLVDRTRFEKLAKTLVFLPLAISGVGASLIWKFVYEFKPLGVPQIGIANQVLVWLGFEPQQFLLSPPWNTLFLIVVMVWVQTGFAMTILSAAIKAIPDDIIEAAKLDGVSGLRMFRYVTVPSIRPAVVVVITTIAMGTLKVFDIVYQMTGGNFSTSVVANEFYTQTFNKNNRGLGATLAVLLFVLVTPIIIYNVKQMRLSEEQR